MTANHLPKPQTSSNDVPEAFEPGAPTRSAQAAPIAAGMGIVVPEAMPKALANPTVPR